MVIIQFAQASEAASLRISTIYSRPEDPDSTCAVSSHSTFAIDDLLITIKVAHQLAQLVLRHRRKVEVRFEIAILPNGVHDSLSTDCAMQD